ncbi:MAG: hypothetical protein K9N22_05185, partial [Candidatus Marinimicrobia bacterium]|nr:hypothetical protein [Candidatus Neomarinimicrobiota bacterium]
EPVEILQGLDQVNPHTGDVFRHHQIALQDKAEKVIWHSNGIHECFDTSTDIRELYNLFPERTGVFQNKLDACQKVYELGRNNRTHVDELMWKLGYF